VELFFHRPVELLAEAISLRGLDLRPVMLDRLDSQVELVGMRARPAAPARPRDSSQAAPAAGEGEPGNYLRADDRADSALGTP